MANVTVIVEQLLKDLVFIRVNFRDDETLLGSHEARGRCSDF